MAKTGIDAELFKPGFAGIIVSRQNDMPVEGLGGTMQGSMKNDIGKFDIVWIKAEHEIDKRRMFLGEDCAAEPPDAFRLLLIVKIVHADRKAPSINSPDGVADSADLEMMRIKGMLVVSIYSIRSSKIIKWRIVPSSAAIARSRLKRDNRAFITISDLISIPRFKPRPT